MWREPMATLDTAHAVSEQPAKKTGMVTRLKDFLRPYFLWVRAGLPARAAAPSWEQSFRVLRRHGLRPATVFDIGVAYGTYQLYRAFPDAYYHLIDPTSQSPHHQRQPTRPPRLAI